MKKNILRCSFVLKIAVILWVISFSSSVLAADYETNFALSSTDCLTTISSETVNATRTEGQVLTFNATGDIISGMLTVTFQNFVRIQTGYWQGWAWRRATYSLAGYTGEAYSIHDFNASGKVWGYWTGDINAVVRKVGNTRIVYITSVNGVPTTGTISLEFLGITSPTSTTQYNDTTLRVQAGARADGTCSGVYTGNYMNTFLGGDSVVLRIPALYPEPGMVIKTFYNTDIGSGFGWAYLDHRGPLIVKVYSTNDGPLFGIHKRQFDEGCYVGRPATGITEHVIDRGHAPEGSDVASVITTRDTKRIRVTFDQILADGTGYVSSQTISSPAPLPDGYTLVGNVYNLDTTANYSGSITVCIDYDESYVPGPESNLKLFHYTGGAWQQLSSSVDTVNNRVCGTTTSLLPFGIGSGSGSGLISGSVLDEQNNPILDMEVIAYDFDTGYFISLAQSNRDGGYTITGLNPGIYKVQANAYGTHFVSQYFDQQPEGTYADPVEVSENLITTDIDFYLTIGAWIKGEVLDPDGFPVEDLFIYAQPQSGGFPYYALTQSDGAYTLVGLPTGDFILSSGISKTDFARQYYNKVHDKTLATPVSVETGYTVTGIDFDLIYGGMISGIIVDCEVIPLPGIKVTASDFGADNWMGESTTSIDGEYTITGLIPGSFKVKADGSSKGFKAEYYDDAETAINASPVDVFQLSNTAGIDFELSLLSLNGDFNHDNDVDGEDLSVLAQDPDLLDIEIFASEYGVCN